MKRLIGKKVYITDKSSIYYDGWGTIVEYDGEFYFIAMFDGKDALPIFSRDQFKIAKIF